MFTATAYPGTAMFKEPIVVKKLKEKVRTMLQTHKKREPFGSL